jgi:integrase
MTKRGWNVYQRSDGAWVVQYKDGDRWREKRIPAEAKIRTQREGEAWARVWTRARAEQSQREEEAQQTPLTLSAYLTAWLDRRDKNPNIRRGTRGSNRSHVDTHIDPKLGSCKFPDLSPALLRDWIVEIRDTPRATTQTAKEETPAVPKPPAPYTVRNIAATLRAALDDAYEEGLLPANPMRSKSVQRELPAGETRAGADIVVHVVRLDAERLLTCPKVPQDRGARYHVGFFAGLRDGEIQGLTCADVVDLEGSLPYVVVNKSLDIRDGKIGKTKTRRGVRKVPLHAAAVKALKAWLSEGWVVLVGRKPKPSDPVFPDADGQHYRPRSAEYIRADLEAAGCATTYAGHPIDFHATRRSFATWLEEAEVPEGIRKRLMGHGGAGVTDESYTAKTLARLAEAVGRISLDLGTDEAAEPRPQTVAEEAPLTAELTACSRYDFSESQMVPGRCGWDSNPRVMVLQTIA